MFKIALGFADGEYISGWEWQHKKCRDFTRAEIIAFVADAIGEVKHLVVEKGDLTELMTMLPAITHLAIKNKISASLELSR